MQVKLVLEFDGDISDLVSLFSMRSIEAEEITKLVEILKGCRLIGIATEGL